MPGTNREIHELLVDYTGALRADKAVPPNMSLFISRVDAEIASRLKKAKVSPRAKRRTQPEPETRTERKAERSI